MEKQCQAMMNCLHISYLLARYSGPGKQTSFSAGLLHNPKSAVETKSEPPLELPKEEG